MGSPLLIDLMPDLAGELAVLLRQQGYAHVESGIPMLRIIDRCRCGDDFCATFYTERRPTGPLGPNHETIDLEAASGMIIVDLVGSSIVKIEVLYREEVRKRLNEILPLSEITK